MPFPRMNCQNTPEKGSNMFKKEKNREEEKMKHKMKN